MSAVHTESSAAHQATPAAQSAAGPQPPPPTTVPHPGSSERGGADVVAIPQAGQPAAPRPSRMLRNVLMLGGILVVLGGFTGVYLTGGRYVGTEDAYVKSAQLNVTTDVSGQVASVEVREGQRVEAGDVLFRLDPEPFEIALANAEASLRQAELTVGSLKADYKRAIEQMHAQEALVDVARTTLDRYSALMDQGSLARTQWDQQQATYLSALATLNSLQQAAAVTLARLDGNPELPKEAFRDVMKAQAAVAEARRQLNHSVVRAPFAGIVTAVNSLQPGALVISAMSAFSTTSAVGLVSDQGLWIEANMKETDLTRVHPGQAVDVTIDTYPDCAWRGIVESVAPASGAAFSPLPSQNISGNWVKVVQRIPVHITLERGSCDARLSTGMSAEVSIDTGYSRLKALGIG